MVEFDCEICKKHVRKRWAKSSPGTPRYCSLACKSEARRRQKPVNREWLYQKYVVEGLDCTAIAKIVNRNPKRVWEWLQDYGIETRKRGHASAMQFGKGQKQRPRPQSPETREKIRQARLRDGGVPYLQNGQHHLKGKRGADTPNWKGGITPERAKVYDSKEWKDAIKVVWARDKAMCQRCGKCHNEPAHRGTFDIHHIVGFECVELRCEPSNLVLLCEDCHYWTHSRTNINKEFIR